MAEPATHLKFLARVAIFVFNIVLLISGQQAFADCESSLKLEGIVSVDCCAPRDNCISAGKANYEYTETAKDDSSVLNISMHASPWHFYDNDMRILTIEDMAEMAKPTLRNGVKRIVLTASWTGVAPHYNGKSLAQKLSRFAKWLPCQWHGRIRMGSKGRYCSYNTPSIHGQA